MPPKTKILREDIISTAVDIVRKNGAFALNARAIAAELGCSTQPVFSNFATMDELREAVIGSAETLYGYAVTKEQRNGGFHPYKAYAMAYIHFAEDEKELFKLLFMRDKSGGDADGIYDPEVIRHAADAAGISEESAEFFHMEFWAFVHGVAVMVADGEMRPEDDLINNMMTDIFEGLKFRFGGVIL